MKQALEDGVNPREGGQDTWHPSAEVSAYFARYLHDLGLLARQDSPD
jgi:hypothetical protein